MPTDRTSIPFSRVCLSIEARQAVADTLRSGWLTTGEQVLAFEAELAQYVGAVNAVGVSSCTAALELALGALHLPAGSRVLLSSITFCGAAGAVLRAGLQPVLADVDPDSGRVTPETVERAARTCGGVAALMVVHLGGYPSDVSALAHAAGVGLDRVIEDAAHALGAEIGSRRIGSISRATCFSFYATKNLAIGEGGMVTTDDDELADDIRSGRLHGMNTDAWARYRPGAAWRYDVTQRGLKANMTDVQAALGRAQLRGFESMQSRRRDRAARYDLNLGTVPGLSLPQRPSNGEHAWHLYAVRIREGFGVSRDEVIRLLQLEGIGTSVHFIPLHQLTYYGHTCIVPPGALPGADAYFEQTLSLPLDPHLAVGDLDRVCASLIRIGA
jgi:perosamine synthetase